MKKFDTREEAIKAGLDYPVKYYFNIKDALQIGQMLGETGDRMAGEKCVLLWDEGCKGYFIRLYLNHQQPPEIIEAAKRAGVDVHLVNDEGAMIQ